MVLFLVGAIGLSTFRYMTIGLTSEYRLCHVKIDLLIVRANKKCYNTMK
ncbi:TPA: universal stress protein [Streptococcus pyogenes]|nr:universal stress protein [Streptococcus pyogenes]HER4684751.1 universal stress protein [Streptococcus pyogenes NGAS353]HER4758911.1 universal stress protein [Streptococcus pyogenes NGAS245]QCK53690.1 universal stress protein [Streptococcus pyogenes]QCK66428.1 universal stress protein [Streptococcus pyogenes]